MGAVLSTVENGASGHQAGRGIRVLHAVHSLDNRLGGAVHAGLNVCRSLVEAGIDVQVVATRGRNDDLEYLRAAYANVPWMTLPRVFPQRWYNGRGLHAKLEKMVPQYDLVEIHAVFSFVCLRTAAAARRQQVPYFLRPHGSLDPFDLRKRALLKRVFGRLLVKPVLDGAAGILCTSALEAERLVTFGATPRRFAVALPVPAGPAVPESAGQDFRVRHRIPADAPVIIFFSRVDYKKGLEYLVPALASLRRLWPQLHFLLVGSGDPAYVSEVRDLLTRHGTLEWTIQTGFLSGEEKQAALAASDIFILPSLNENFGMAIVEAMRAGLPVVISREVYIHQEIVHAQAGVVCGTSADSCEKALRQLLEAPPNYRVAMGQRGRTLAENAFSNGATTSRLLGIYEEALAAKSSRRLRRSK